MNPVCREAKDRRDAPAVHVIFSASTTKKSRDIFVALNHGSAPFSFRGGSRLRQAGFLSTRRGFESFYLHHGNKRPASSANY